MIPYRNGRRYLSETLKSVLEQDPGPNKMQIAVVDDASDEDPRPILSSLAGERVEYYRNVTNLGIPQNFNKCIRLAKGYWVHILNQDDCVLGDFYRKFQSRIEEYPSLVALFCRVIFIDERGNWVGLSDLDLPESGVYPRFASVEVVSNRVWMPGMVVARHVYERLGGFRPELPYSCDWDMWNRVARAGPVWFETRPLVLYRLHKKSESSRRAHLAENIGDMRRVVSLAGAYLASEERFLLAKARRKVAEIALVSARKALDAGQLRTAWAHLREAILAAPYPITAINATLTTLASLVRRVLRPQHRL